MAYSRRVSLAGLLIGVGGVFTEHEVLVIGGFIIIAAAAICKAIEDK